MNNAAAIIANALISSNLDCWRPPAYYLEKKNVIKLLEIIIDGTSTSNDLDVFLCVPVRYDHSVEGIRLHCKKINESKGFIHPYRLFTDKGIMEVKKILSGLLGLPGVGI